MKRLLCLVCLMATLLTLIPAPAPAGAGAVSSDWLYIANVPVVDANGGVYYLRLVENGNNEKVLVFTDYDAVPLGLKLLAWEISPGVYAVSTSQLKEEPCRILVASLPFTLPEWHTVDFPHCLSLADPVVAAYRKENEVYAVVLLGPDYSLPAPKYLSEATARALCKLSEAGATDAGSLGLCVYYLPS